MTKRGPTLHFVEIKYCRNTDRSNQEQHAHEQHNQLEDAIHAVQTILISIGVFGPTYEDSITALKNWEKAKDRQANAARSARVHGEADHETYGLQEAC